MFKKSKTQKRVLAVLLSAAMAFTSVNFTPLNTVTAYADQTVLADGDYFIRSVSTGKFLNGANSLGTQESVTPEGQLMTVAASTNGYTINSHYKNEENKNFVTSSTNDAGTAWLDGLTEDLEITQNDAGNYTVSSASGTYMNAPTDGGSIVLWGGLSEASEWEFLTRDELIAEAVTKVAGGESVDLSSLIMDANFSRNNQYNSSWTTSGAGYVLGGDNANLCAERWHNTFDVKQVIEGLPNGKYELSLQGFWRNDGDGSAASVYYANGASKHSMSIEDDAKAEQTGGWTTARGSVYVPNSMNDASAVFTAGAYVNEPLEFDVTDGTATIGIKCDSTKSWVIFDNFTLKLKEVSKAEILKYGGISVDSSSIEVDKTNTEEFKVNLPASVSANDVEITYTSSDAETVEVTKDVNDATKAIVKGLKAGNAEVNVSVSIGEVVKTAKVAVKVEETDIPVLVSFDFDEGETTDGSVLEGEGGKAIVHNSGATLVDSKEGNGKALSLTSGTDYAELVKTDDSSILTGKDVVTISYDLLAGAGNWNFFAARTADTPTYGSTEYYLGAFAGSTIFERYNGARSNANASSKVSGVSVPNTGWNHFDVVVTSEGTWVYVNGTLGGYAKSPTSLSSMLKDNSVLYLGKATWGGGEYGACTIDNFTIYDGVLYSYAEKVFEDSATITAEETLDVRVDDVVKNVNAQVTASTNVKVSYASSDETVATVDAEGNITAIKEGNVVITTTMKCGKKVKTAETAVTVKPAIPTEAILAEEGIKVTGNVKVLAGETAQISVTLPSKLQGAEGVSVSYNSIDPTVATVEADSEDDTKAVVTGVSKGCTKIVATATMGQTSRTAETQVKVTVAPTTSLVGDFTFEDSLEDEVTGNDAVAVQKGLAPYGGEVEYDEGHNGKAVKLGSYGIQLDKKNLGKEFTVSAWLKATDTIAVNQATIFLGYHNPELWAGLSGNENNTYKFWVRNTVDAEGAHYNVWDTLATTPVSTEWKQYTIVGSEGKIALYVDGVLVVEGDCKEVLDGENQNIYIGVTNWDTPYAGLADDVKVYNEALNAEAVAELYTSTLTEDELAAVAARAAVAKIDAIGTVTLESKAAIDTARAAYDALTDAQKAFVTADQLKVLTDAEARYAELVAEADQAVVDQAAADAAVAKIDAIGTVALTDACKAAIDDARVAYDALTAEQKALVTAAKLKVLTDAEASYAELVAEAEQAAADQAAAEAAVAKIDAIGTVTLESKAAIDAARAAYDALTAEQKALVTAEQLKVLTAAEAKYAELVAAAAKKPLATGTKATGGVGEYTVTNAAAESPEVSFIPSATPDSTSAVVPATVKIDGIIYKVTKIEPYAYEGFTELKKITVPSTVKEIGAHAFEACESLKTITLPADLGVIGDNAFAECEVLKSITIPAKVTTIGKQAFSKCPKLKKITVKSTVLKKVGKNALKGINAKATIKVPKKQLKTYQKLFKKKGQASTVKIKK